MTTPMRAPFSPPRATRGRGAGLAPSRRGGALALALTRTLALYGLMCWVYVAIISIVQPSWLGLRLTHFASFPHVDTFGEASFAVSIVCYFCYRLLLERAGRRDSAS